MSSPSVLSAANASLRRSNSSVKLDHLGKAVIDTKHRHKFLPSTTMIYNHSSSRHSDIAEVHWTLVSDARSATDLSLPICSHMADLFRNASDDGEGVTTVSPKAFHTVLRDAGLVDPVQVQCIFDGFAEHLGGAKIDYRELLRAFITATSDPIEERLSLLFDVYDLDGQGFLSLAELIQMIAPISRPKHFQTTKKKSRGPRGEQPGKKPPQVDISRLLDAVRACARARERVPPAPHAVPPHRYRHGNIYPAE